MNESAVVKRKPFVLAVLLFSVLIFVIGTVLFFKSDYENKALRATLLRDGIRTKGYVHSKSIEENKRLSTNSSNWQYSKTHFIIFEYDHVMKQGANKLSLEHHLSKNKEGESAFVSAKGLGRLESQSLVDERLYDRLQPGQAIDIVYLAGEPSSVRLLNKEGKVEIPMLSIFSYICLFLTLGSLCSFCFYLKTGRTF